MLGSNKYGIINLDLAATDNNIRVNRIVCIGNTTSDGKLRIYFSKDCANRKSSCKSHKNSLFLLVCNLLPKKATASLLSEDELSQNNSTIYYTSRTVNMYFLVMTEKINAFLLEVHSKVLRKEKLIFNNLDMYGICVLAREVRNTLLGNDSFDECKALQSVKNQLLANAEYRSYDVEEKDIIKEKSLHTYAIFARAIDLVKGIIIEEVKCIGNTEPGDYNLRVYINKNRKEKILPIGTSLFILVCKVPHDVIKISPTLNEIFLRAKSNSLISRIINELFFMVFLLVFENKLPKFLYQLNTQQKSSNVVIPSEYGKVVFAYPLRNSIKLKKNCLSWELKILKELGILESVMESRLIILGENEPKTLLLSSENQLGNYSSFSSFQEEEAAITTSSNGSAFSTLRERVSTLFNNVKPSQVGHRNVNHQ